jgi:biopolymer transport protein ExbD
MSGGSKKKGLPLAPHHGINVTPMIDLIMCLIIFFLLAAQLSNDEIDAAVELPKVRQAKEYKLDSLGNRVMVNILPANPARNEPLRYVIRGHEYKIEQIKGVLATAVAKNSDVRMTLRPSSAVKYQDIMMLMVLAGQTQVKEVMFAAARAN